MGTLVPGVGLSTPQWPDRSWSPTPSPEPSDVPRRSPGSPPRLGSARETSISRPTKMGTRLTVGGEPTPGNYRGLSVHPPRGSGGDRETSTLENTGSGSSVSDCGASGTSGGRGGRVGVLGSGREESPGTSRSRVGHQVVGVEGLGGIVIDDQTGDRLDRGPEGTEVIVGQEIHSFDSVSPNPSVFGVGALSSPSPSLHPTLFILRCPNVPRHRVSGGLDSHGRGVRRATGPPPRPPVQGPNDTAVGCLRVPVPGPE